MITSYIYPIMGVALHDVINYSNTTKPSGSSNNSTVLISTQVSREYANLLSRHNNSL